MTTAFVVNSGISALFLIVLAYYIKQTTNLNKRVLALLRTPDSERRLLPVEFGPEAGSVFPPVNLARQGETNIITNGEDHLVLFTAVGCPLCIDVLHAIGDYNLTRIRQKIVILSYEPPAVDSDLKSLYFHTLSETGLLYHSVAEDVLKQMSILRFPTIVHVDGQAQVTGTFLAHPESISHHFQFIPSMPALTTQNSSA